MTRHDPKAKVRQLLYELCVDLGFCLPPQEHHRLQEAPPADVDGFTDAVFEAEGMDPGLHEELRRQVRDRVDRHMRGWGAPWSTGIPDDEPGERRPRPFTEGDGNPL
ncbi:hypothetical protein AB0L35_07740 [Streptomyces sp. NPDC052309]|uniref:Uncharacterized protein n=1 Tax=Streptomyces griseicoloratus TaxID=2752516 RepID=A0A926L358_9ACTN|nr:hypothetical protein [Streptomyces griseicoloratus]MBD0421680.1 hypothetical protein [Streptomyces griseicoloratus]